MSQSQSQSLSQSQPLPSSPVSEVKQEVKQEPKNSVPLDPQAKESHRLNSVDKDDTCYLCHEVLKIPAIPVPKPARFGSACKCKYHVCVDCMREYISNCHIGGGRNDPHFHNFNPPKCLMCHKLLGCYQYDPVQQRSHLMFYIKDLTYAAILDKRHPEGMKCYRCNWVGSRMDFETKHMAECNGIHASCPNFKDGCHTMMPRKDIAEHLKVCKFRREHCKHCKQLFLFENLDIHEQDCPARPAICKYCHQEVRFGDLNHHVQQCREEFPNIMWDKLITLTATVRALSSDGVDMRNQLHDLMEANKALVERIKVLEHKPM